MKRFISKSWEVVLNFLGIGSKTPEPEIMPIKAVKVLVFLAVALGVTLLSSNLAALKIWGLSIPWPTSWSPFKSWGIAVTLPVDAGVWLFPITYIVGDLLMNTFGKKLANMVAVYAVIFAVLTALALWFARVTLPDFEGVDNSAFEIIQSATGRIFLASLLGFLAGQLVNNYWFELIYECQKMGIMESKTETSAVRKCVLLSSLPAHFIDSLLFEVLAFWGRVSPREFMLQVGFAFTIGLVIETLLGWKLTPYLAIKLKCKLHYEDGKKI